MCNEHGHNTPWKLSKITQVTSIVLSSRHMVLTTDRKHTSSSFWLTNGTVWGWSAACGHLSIAQHDPWLRDLSMLAQIVDPSTAQHHRSIAQIGRSCITCISFSFLPLYRQLNDLDLLMHQVQAQVHYAWNSLPEHLRQTTSTDLFKRSLETKGWMIQPKLHQTDPVKSATSESAVQYRSDNVSDLQ